MRIAAAGLAFGVMGFWLTACGQSPLSKAQTRCMFETNAKGSYISHDDGAFVPDTGASQAEADALNACVSRKLATAKGGSRPSSQNGEATPAATPGARQIVRSYSWTSGSPAVVTTSADPAAAAVSASPRAPAATAPLRKEGSNGICRMTMVGGAGYACVRD